MDLDFAPPLGASAKTPFGKSGITADRHERSAVMLLECFFQARRGQHARILRSILRASLGLCRANELGQRGKRGSTPLIRGAVLANWRAPVPQVQARVDREDASVERLVSDRPRIRGYGNHRTNLRLARNS